MELYLWQSMVASAVVAAAIIAVTLVTMNVVRDNQWDTQHQHYETDLSRLSARIVEIVKEADSAVYCAAGFALPCMLKHPVINHTSTNITERMVDCSEKEAFDRLGLGLVVRIPGLASLQLQPSGIVTMVYPNNSGTLGYDILADPALAPQILAGMNTSGAPRLLGVMKRLAGGYGIIVRLTMFNNSYDHTIQSWWGDVVAILDSQYFATELQQLPTYASNDDLCWALYDTTNATHRAVIANSSNCNVEDLIRDGVHGDVVRNTVHWELSVAPRSGWCCSNNKYVVVVIFVTIFGVAALVSAIQAVRCVSALKYDGLANAPKLPPFAMAQIDIMKSSEMWAEAPLAMTDTLQRFAEIVRKHISATKGYEAQAVGGGYLIANRSSTKIMRMFEGIRQDVQKESWPTEVLGAQGNCRDRSSLSFSAPTTLLIRLTAHYCKAVDILFDPSTKALRYSGNDVFYLGQLHAVSDGNIITMSSKFRSVLNEKKLADTFCIISVGKRKLRGFKDMEDVFVAKSIRISRPDDSPQPRATPSLQDSSLSSVGPSTQNPMAANGGVSMIVQEPDITSLSDAAGEAVHMIAQLRDNFPTPPLAESIYETQHLYALSTYVPFEALRPLICELFEAYRILFSVFAPPERKNIFRRIHAAFGFPPEHTLVNLSVKAALLMVRNCSHANGDQDSVGPIPQASDATTTVDLE